VLTPLTRWLAGVARGSQELWHRQANPSLVLPFSKGENSNGRLVISPFSSKGEQEGDLVLQV